jgi:O-antigen/teichoic acid export membrane protein
MVVDAAVGLIAFPLILRSLGPRDAGFWFVCTAVAGALTTMMTCLSPMATRFLAQTIAGDPGLDPLASTVSTIRRAYSYLTCAALLLFACTYLIYIYRVAPEVKPQSKALVWTIYASAMVLQLWFQYYGTILNGTGRVAVDRALRSSSGVCLLLLNLIVLKLAPHLELLACCTLMQSIGLLLGARFTVKRCLPGAAATCVTSSEELQERAVRLLKSSAVMFVPLAANSFTSNFPLIIIERFYGIERVAPYAAVTKIFAMLANASLLGTQLLYPHVAAAWASKDHERVRKFYLSGAVLSLGFYILGASSILLTSNLLLAQWIGTGRYLGSAVSAGVAIFYLSYVFYCSNSTPLLAAVGDPMVRISLWTAALVAPACVCCALLLPLPAVPFAAAVAAMTQYLRAYFKTSSRLGNPFLIRASLGG